MWKETANEQRQGSILGGIYSFGVVSSCGFHVHLRTQKTQQPQMGDEAARLESAAIIACTEMLAPKWYINAYILRYTFVKDR